ncbi:MAG: sigma-70 family RNA polymerase sigma factor [Candidatus Cloacimonetes bacterium]|nr:sigma-70 family RNA polymerase sigma factor [Candidatus Cloacimonadota bacterium]
MNKSVTELFKRCEKKIAAYLYRMQVNRDDIDDLLQEIFLRAWKSWEKYDQNQDFLPWVYTIARNERIRWQKKQYRFLLEKNEKVCSKDTSETPEELNEKNEIREQVKNAVFTLPEKLQEPLVLKHYQNLTFIEISKVLDVPVTTVKSRVYLALKQLARRVPC